MNAVVGMNSSTGLSSKANKPPAINNSQASEGLAEQLVLPNLPLAAHIAKRWGIGAIDQEDLVQEAKLCLVKASLGYDPQKGSFTSYAGRSIELALSELQGSSGNLRVPKYLHDLTRAWSKAAKKLPKDSSPEAIAAQVNKDKLGEAELKNKELWLKPTRIQFVLAALEAKRLEAKMHGQSIVDFDGRPMQHADPLQDTPVQIAEWNEKIENVQKKIAELPAQQRKLLKCLFPADGSKATTLGAISERWNMSTWQIKAIKKSAFAALRRSLTA